MSKAVPISDIFPDNPEMEKGFLLLLKLEGGLQRGYGEGRPPISLFGMETINGIRITQSPVLQGYIANLADGFETPKLPFEFNEKGELVAIFKDDTPAKQEEKIALTKAFIKQQVAPFYRDKAAACGLDKIAANAAESAIVMDLNYKRGAGTTWWALDQVIRMQDPEIFLRDIYPNAQEVLGKALQSDSVKKEEVEYLQTALHEKYNRMLSLNDGVMPQSLTQHKDENGTHVISYSNTRVDRPSPTALSFQSEAGTERTLPTHFTRDALLVKDGKLNALQQHILDSVEQIREVHGEGAIALDLTIARLADLYDEKTFSPERFDRNATGWVNRVAEVYHASVAHAPLPIRSVEQLNERLGYRTLQHLTELRPEDPAPGLQLDGYEDYLPTPERRAAAVETIKAEFHSRSDNSKRLDEIGLAQLEQTDRLYGYWEDSYDGSKNDRPYLPLAVREVMGKQLTISNGNKLRIHAPESFTIAAQDQELVLDALTTHLSVLMNRSMDQLIAQEQDISPESLRTQEGLLKAQEWDIELGGRFGLNLSKVSKTSPSATAWIDSLKDTLDEATISALQTRATAISEALTAIRDGSGKDAYGKAVSFTHGALLFEDPLISALEASGLERHDIEMHEALERMMAHDGAEDIENQALVPHATPQNFTPSTPAKVT